jgi:hypothetical protein
MKRALLLISTVGLFSMFTTGIPPATAASLDFSFVEVSDSKHSSKLDKSDLSLLQEGRIGHKSRCHRRRTCK